MKTKSYKIYASDKESWVEMSETLDQSQIKIRVLGMKFKPGSQVIYLDAKGWEELCDLKYDLKCEEQYIQPAVESDLSLPMADETIDRLKKGAL